MSADTTHFKWSWLANDNDGKVVEKIMGMVERPLNYKPILGLDSKNRITIDNDVVPHQMLPYLFQNAYGIKTLNTLPSTKYDFTGTKYDIFINHTRFSLIEEANGDIKYLKDDKLDCSVGPAMVLSKGKDIFYYKNGSLHRSDGPAKITDKAEYFLDGKPLYLSEYVENNPDNKVSNGYRGKSNYVIHRWQNYATVSGLDGTKALLKKTESPPNTDTFLSELFAHPISDYTVVDYPQLGASIRPVYNLVRDCGPWFYEGTPNKSILRAANTIDETTLSFNKETKELVFSSFEFSPPLTLRFDMSFEGPAHTDALANVLIRRDANGRKHSLIGPALRLPNGQEQYYIYGQKISKEEFDSKQVDLDGRVYWTGKEGSLHNPSTYTPAEIQPDSSCKHFYNGKLHSETLPAVETQGTDFRINRYFIYGNEISSKEFCNFDRFSNQVSFKRDGQYHRDDGPAYILFDKTGRSEKRWYKNGALHNDNGPAIEYSDGICEYWLNGIKFQGNIDAMNVKSKIKLTPIPRPSVRVNLKGENMKSIKIGQSGADVNDSRAQQVMSGTKLGLKKGAIKVGSEKAAKALSGVIPLPDALPAERLLQLVLLLGTAEVMERLPDGMASKVGMTQERREEFSGLSRFISGEILGRDAIDIVSQIAPMLVDAVRQISTEDILDLSNDFEAPVLSEVVEEVGALAVQRR